MNSLTGKRLNSQALRPLLSTIRPLLTPLHLRTHVSVGRGAAHYTQNNVPPSATSIGLWRKATAANSAENPEAGMVRIGRVLMFIAASVISGLALAFLIVAWRPQLVTGAPPPPASAAGPDKDGTPRPYQPEADNGSARPGVTIAPDAEHPAILVPGHDAWSYADAAQRAGPAVVNISTT